VSHRCVVEAPDAFAAFVLAHRIDPLGAGAEIETDGRGYLVSLQTAAEGLPHVLEIVQAWLVEERIGQTTVRFGGRTQLLHAA